MAKLIIGSSVTAERSTPNRPIASHATCQQLKTTAGWHSPHATIKTAQDFLAFQPPPPATRVSRSTSGTQLKAALRYAGPGTQAEPDPRGIRVSAKRD